MEPATDPENPTDPAPTTAADVLEGDGGHGQFRVGPDARIQCLTCRALIDAHDVSADRMTRLEGASDPDDMMMVVPLRCPTCGTSGSLTLAYGPHASPEEQDVLGALERTPSRSQPTAAAVGLDASPGSGATIVVLTDDTDSPSVRQALRWSIDLAHDSHARLVLYDRSAETWADTPHPSGELPPADPLVIARPHLAAQVADAAQREVDVVAWLSTLPTLGAVTSAILATAADVVVLPEGAAGKLADRLVPSDDPAGGMGTVHRHSGLPPLTMVRIGDDGGIDVRRAPGDRD